MKEIGYVTGSKAQAEELIVGTDTVYVHTDIQKLNEVDDNGNPIEIYRYHEVQYEKDEYIKLMAEQNKTLDQQLTDTQLALVEIYEGMVV